MGRPEDDHEVRAVLTRREANHLRGAIRRYRWKSIPPLGDIQREVPLRTLISLHLGCVHIHTKPKAQFLGCYDPRANLVSSQSLCLAEISLCPRLVREHGNMVMANFFPRLCKLWVNLDGTLERTQRLRQRMRTRLRTKLYQITTQHPKRRRLRKNADGLIGESDQFQ